MSDLPVQTHVPTIEEVLQVNAQLQQEIDQYIQIVKRYEKVVADYKSIHDMDSKTQDGLIACNKELLELYRQLQVQNACYARLIDPEPLH
jgi:hypothetical protein